MLLTGCAVGEWRDLTVRVPPDVPPPPTTRRYDPCQVSGRRDEELAETIRDFARVHLAEAGSKIFVSARAEVSNLTIIAPDGSYGLYYCIGVVRSGITTTLVFHSLDQRPGMR